MAFQFKPVESRRLYQQIADQIRELIDQGGFEAGTRLPPERDLAQQLGVSRPSLREALIALDVEGRVEVRSGSGVFVSAAQPDRAVGTDRGDGRKPEPVDGGALDHRRRARHPRLRADHRRACWHGCANC